MREVPASKITEVVRDLVIKANTELGEDVVQAVKDALSREESPTGRAILQSILQNVEVSRKTKLPLCQDTGLAVVFVDVGQEVHITGGSLEDAINEGVRRGYKEGYLRKSVVKDPLRRVNTGDNTPAVIHTRIVPGDKIRIAVAPKGGGSEGMSVARVFPPSAGWEGVKRFIVEHVDKIGGNPCPPTVLGIGIGGNFELSAILAKRAIVFRKIGQRNPDPFWAEKELELLEEINKLGVGPMGLGGRVTALDVFIEVAPTHLVMIPVAINVQCHANRHAYAEI